MSLLSKALCQYIAYLYGFFCKKKKKIQESVCVQALRPPVHQHQMVWIAEVIGHPGGPKGHTETNGSSSDRVRICL